MVCPLCGKQKAKRSCPALSRDICPVCCGTKRLTEIRCVPECPYLTTSRTHPAAVVRRQTDRDRALLLPSVQPLTSNQIPLLWMILNFLNRYVPDLMPPTDEDLAQAAGALASTYETAARGVIYEHAAASLPAQRLVTELKALFEDMRTKGPASFDADVPAVLRLIEKEAREIRKRFDEGPRTYLQLLRRVGLLAQQEAAGRPRVAESGTGSSLILP